MQLLKTYVQSLKINAQLLNINTQLLKTNAQLLKTNVQLLKTNIQLLKTNIQVLKIDKLNLTLKPELLNDIKAFNPNNKMILKDIMKFKLNKSKVES